MIMPFAMRTCSIFLQVMLLLLLLLSISSFTSIISANSLQLNASKTYIIHMDHSQKPNHFSTHESWHQHTLSSASCPQNPTTFLYSYTHVMHGFSAKLTPCQLAAIENSPAHLATYKESFGKMATTHTPKFLGLNRGLGIWPAASFGKDVIIGVFDSGIWPESESFNDRGMSMVPSRWKGGCENGTAFSPSLCNNKLIGARSFSKGAKAAAEEGERVVDFDSPRDFDGHGTHTSSTAAGNHVYGASHFGYAKGTAKGIAPRAHLAMYKVLWGSEGLLYAASDLLAAMDQAISDGVDIMSLSIGWDKGQTSPLFEDVIAVASLSAVEKGIVVVCSAGNSGPDARTINNGAPWIVTVGAGTMDRSFVATLELGNGMSFEGTSYFPTSVSITNAPLYYGFGCLVLKPDEVKGKVVLCDDGKLDIDKQMVAVTLAGAYGAIFLTESTFRFSPEYYLIPGVLLHTRYAKTIKEYAISGNNTTVKSMRFVLTKTGLTAGPAPQVAYFSSRGPDPFTPNVLKPDIIAPGVDVLAAVRPDVRFTVVGGYNLVTDYALMSGTSMAAPHVAGVAALIKAVHRDWSPAAIRSAMMTSATKTDNTHGTFRDQSTGDLATPLAFGAGHVNPNRAMDPGLIYDIRPQDYIDFLCGLGYTSNQMTSVLRTSRWSCGNDNHTDLNYPSFMIVASNEPTSEKRYVRTVTNVGEDASTYRAVLRKIPEGMTVKVEPKSIRFTSKYEEQKFVVSIELVVDKDSSKVNYGYLEWIDDEHKHVVSSPIVVMKD